MRCCQGKPRDGTFHNNQSNFQRLRICACFPPQTCVFFPKDPLPKRRRSIHEFRIRSPNHWIFGPKIISMKLTFSPLKIGNIPKGNNQSSKHQFSGVFIFAGFVSGRVKKFYTKKKLPQDGPTVQLWANPLDRTLWCSFLTRRSPPYRRWL